MSQGARVFLEEFACIDRYKVIASASGSLYISTRDSPRRRSGTCTHRKETC